MSERKCKKCGVVKALGEFPRNPTSKDGHTNECRECTNAYARVHRLKYPERSRAASKKYYKKKGRKRNHTPSKAQRLAYNTVKNAIRSGKVTRPDRCDWCRSNKYRIEAHHFDYAKPLDVTWLCAPCHHRLHHGHPYPIMLLCEVFDIKGVLNGQM